MTIQTRLPAPPQGQPRSRRRVRSRPSAAGASALASTLPTHPPASDHAERHCRKLRSRIIRNGVVVVGGSTLASVAFTEAAFHVVGSDSYTGSMIAAAVIPLMVAGPVYGWIAALTLRLDRSNAALDRLAHTDPLTGIANRRAAMATLAEWTTPGAPARGCALAIIDIDDFKCINDRFGHDTGDAALCHVALMLERLVPAGWLVARIGGEEFLIAAPASAGTGFAARIEAIRTGLTATPLITPAGPHTITASFGLAEWQPAEPLERLLGRADRALYRAKETGRNRVETAT
jgi:diguanylate cyclase (GGDEF)-like protein